MEYSLFTIFFPSYLQVAGHFSPAKATRIEYVYSSTFKPPSSLFLALRGHLDCDRQLGR